MSERLNLVVGDGVGETLTKLAGSERARGAWVSKLVMAYAETGERAQANSLDELRFAFAGLMAEQKMNAARIAQLEQQLSALIAAK